MGRKKEKREINDLKLFRGRKNEFVCFFVCLTFFVVACVLLRLLLDEAEFAGCLEGDHALSKPPVGTRHSSRRRRRNRRSNIVFRFGEKPTKLNISPLRRNHAKRGFLLRHLNPFLIFSSFVSFLLSGSVYFQLGRKNSITVGLRINLLLRFLFIFGRPIHLPRVCLSPRKPF